MNKRLWKTLDNALLKRISEITGKKMPYKKPITKKERSLYHKMQVYRWPLSPKENN